jgi:hypothetical protein
MCKLVGEEVSARVILQEVGHLVPTVMLMRCRWCAADLRQVADGNAVFFPGPVVSLESCS